MSSTSNRSQCDSSGDYETHWPTVTMIGGLGAAVLASLVMVAVSSESPRGSAQSVSPKTLAVVATWDAPKTELPKSELPKTELPKSEPTVIESLVVAHLADVPAVTEKPHGAVVVNETAGNNEGLRRSAGSAGESWDSEAVRAQRPERRQPQRLQETPLRVSQEHLQESTVPREQKLREHLLSRVPDIDLDERRTSASRLSPAANQLEATNRSVNAPHKASGAESKRLLDVFGSQASLLDPTFRPFAEFVSHRSHRARLLDGTSQARAGS